MKNRFLPSIKVSTSLLLVVLLITANTNKSIAQTYTFSTFTAPYVELTNDTSITSNLIWVAVFDTIPLGFNFQIDSTIFNELSIHYSVNVATPFSLDAIYTLWPMESDICDRAWSPPYRDDGDTGSVSNISYKTEGTVGNRICKIQWQNVGFMVDFFVDSLLTDSANYQVWLYEADNSVEYRYGPNQIKDSHPIRTEPGGFTVGFGEWDTTWQDWNMQFVNGTISSYSFDTCEDFTCPGVRDSIPNGTVFRFAPPIPNAISNSAKIHNIRVFPNPTSGTFNIANIAPDKIKQIEIWNTLGQMSLELKPSTDLDISDLASGIYSIRVITDEAIYVSRLQKN